MNNIHKNCGYFLLYNTVSIVIKYILEEEKHG